MKVSSRYKDAFKQARKSPEYWTERVQLELSRQFTGAMKAFGLSQKALAERLEKKPEFLSRVFSGRQNVTLSTVSTIAHALDMHLEIKLVPNAVEERKQSYSVTSPEVRVPRDGVVIKSHRLTLVRSTNDTMSSPTIEYRSAA
ncbi:helix-turn-helix domain-containing protein [Burkholderia ubonensis]|uniref:helix-turn-helix domain-containing protein n=1 Tax=Burkholderia ubonensis TaxID=101571 RepID=UPI000B0E78C9|nr:helix-turn-helix transcriptional regulator [Burkholderia ubonensis]